MTKGVKALIIASIDGTTLSAVLQQAADAGIKVIAYDRLIRDSGNVDYYTTFDNFKVGVLQAELAGQGPQGALPGRCKPWNVELFGGSPDDNNAFFFYDGAMSVLQPLIDNGAIVIKSGQMGMEKVGTLRWDGAVAQARMDNILSANYSDGSRVHGVLAPYDGLSRGIISSLRGVGYGTADQPWPIVTGQDAETPSVKAIIAGEQYSTVFKDTRELAKVTAEPGRRRAVRQGSPKSTTPRPTTTASRSFRRYLLVPVSVDKTNYEANRGRLRLHQGRRPEVTADDMPGPRAMRGALFDCRPPAISDWSAGQLPSSDRPVMDRTILEMRGITKTFPGVKALQNVNLNVRARRDPRHRRRKRRRQIDADEGALRRLSRTGPMTATILYRGQECRFHGIHDSERNGHRHHPPGTGAGAAAVDRRKHLPRQRAGQARRHRLERRTQTRRANCSEGRPERGSRHAGHQHRRRQAAAGRDRQGAVQGSQAADPRRADREPLREGQRGAARPAARVQAPGHRLDPDLAQAQRGRQVADRDHHPARRPDHRDARREDEITEDRIITSMVGRTLDGPLSAAHAQDRRDDVRGEELERLSPAASPTGRSSRTSTSMSARARSSASPG